MKAKKIFLAVASLLALGGAAQQLPLYSQYTILPYLYNPALVGFSGEVNSSLMHRSQWKGIPGAPVTSVFTTEGAIQEKNMGIGLTVFNDNTDIIQRLGFYGMYSYHLKLNDDQKLLFGLSFGVQNQRIDFTRAVIKDDGDPYLMFKTAQRKTFLDATLGVTYMWKTLEVGLAVPQLIGNQVEYNNTTGSSWFYNTQHYLFTAKYSYMFNEEKGMSVYPLVLLRYAKGSPFQYDINAVFDWAKRGWAGLCYKSNYAVGVNVGFRVNNSLRAGYAYDYSINSVKNFIGGAHEFFLGYTFGGRKESEEPFTPPTAGVSDSVIKELSAINEKQTEEINKLKTEVEELRMKQDSVKLAISQPPVEIVKAEEFKTESGAAVSKGFYVVIGAFKNVSNAENLKSAIAGKYPNADLFFNKNRGFHYVYVFKSDSLKSAEEVELEMQKQYPDAWIFDLE